MLLLNVRLTMAAIITTSPSLQGLVGRGRAAAGRGGFRESVEGKVSFRDIPTPTVNKVLRTRSGAGVHASADATLTVSGVCVAVRLFIRESAMWWPAGLVCSLEEVHCINADSHAWPMGKGLGSQASTHIYPRQHLHSSRQGLALHGALCGRTLPLSPQLLLKSDHMH